MGVFKIQLPGEPSGLPEERPGLNVSHSLLILCRGTFKCFLGCLTKYSNEPLAFSLHKAQRKVLFSHSEGQFLCRWVKPRCRVKTQEKYKMNAEETLKFNTHL